MRRQWKSIPFIVDTDFILPPKYYIPQCIFHWPNPTKQVSFWWSSGKIDLLVWALPLFGNHFHSWSNFSSLKFYIEFFIYIYLMRRVRFGLLYKVCLLKVAEATAHYRRIILHRDLMVHRRHNKYEVLIAGVQGHFFALFALLYL